MGRREVGVGCDSTPPQETFPMGGGTMGKGYPTLRHPAFPSALVGWSVLPPLLLHFELSSQGSFAESCLFGIPG